MIWLGELIQRLGIAAAVVGYGIYALAVLWRLVELSRTRTVSGRTWVIGFYARAAGTLGVMISVLGLVVRDPAQWPWLIVVFIFGAPALALLLVRPVRPEDVSPNGGRRRKT